MDKQYEVARSLNATLEQLNSISACGPNCKRELKKEELKQAYQNALQSDENKGELLQNSRKNYYTFAFGEGYYNDSERERLTKVADEHVKKLLTKHDALHKEIVDQKNQKTENEIAVERMNQLHKKYDISNDNMLNNMDNKEAVVETSHRRVFYTMQKMDRLIFYQKFVSIVLKILLLVSLFYFIYKKKYVSLVIIFACYLLIRHLS